MSQTAIAPQPGATNQQVLTDAQLLALIVRSENRALSEIYDRYTRLVFSRARLSSGTRQVFNVGDEHNPPSVY